MGEMSKIKVFIFPFGGSGSARLRAETKGAFS
jgi:hypothetical protein